MFTRMVLVLVALAAMLTIPATPVGAAEDRGQNVILDETITVPVGGSKWACFDAPYMTRIDVMASAPSLHPGEAAVLVFRDDFDLARPTVYLYAPLGTEPTVGAFPAGAGTYCYNAWVTGTESGAGRDVRLTITTDPTFLSRP